MMKKTSSIIIILILIFNLLCPIISYASEEIISITFKDPNLYVAITNSQYITIESKDDTSLTINMTKENVDNLRYIAFIDAGITNLDGIDKFPNLMSLDFSNNQIEDISILSNLTKLSTIQLKY